MSPFISPTPGKRRFARIAIVPSKRAMGGLLAVTAQAARVIAEGANDATWRRATMAA